MDRQFDVLSAASAGGAGAEAAVIASGAGARAFRRALDFAPARTPVVIVGPTGAGKSYLAKYIHRHSPRCGGPFVDRTAAEIAETLSAAQLFGHERGAFTGAYERRPGLFAEADGGTLLIDDLHLMPLSVQASLLRALGEGVYRSLGAHRDCLVQCRIIVAVRECPDLLVRRGVLLPDLRYRLGSCVIWLLPLSERREEIGPFAEAFLRRCPDETGVRGPARFAPDVVPALERASWPGNLRELKAAVECAYLHAQGEAEIRLAHFDDVVSEAAGGAFRRRGRRDSNRRAVEIALELAGGSQTEAARLLGVNRHTVRRYAATTPEDAPAK